MSTDPREPNEGIEPLTNRRTFELYLRDQTLRPYLLAALGSLAMIFLVLFLGGSDTGAVMVLLFGMASLLFRWSAGPPLLLVMLLYFQLFPFGIPDFSMLVDNRLEVKQTHFRVEHVIMVMSVLVFFRSIYRIIGLTYRSMPFESTIQRKGEYPTRRPLAHIKPSEIAWMIGGAAAIVIAGQLTWWVVNNLEYAPTNGGFPLRWVDTESTSRYFQRRHGPGEFTPGANRFFVMVGTTFFGLLFLRLAFGYWRMRAMSAAEGAVVLADTSWSESHRERVRVEKWRIWGRARAKEQAKKQARRARTSGKA